MRAEQKIVQYLNEAHALEGALVQTLTAHIAITPRGDYRDALAEHLDETRRHAQAIEGRLGELGQSRNPIQAAYGLAQTVTGQVVAMSKAPLDLLRGTGGEEKLVKNAKDEIASEALEIATYDALEALATAVGDEDTARLAREHRRQEERMLARLRELLADLTLDMASSEFEDAHLYDLTSTGAADAVRAATGRFRREEGDEAGANGRAAARGSGARG